MNNTQKRNVAVVFGGCSPEYHVSLSSAYAVIRGLEETGYHLILIGISRDGDWFYYTGSPDRIPDDAWNNQADCVPAALSPNRSARELIVLDTPAVRRIPVDVLFPVLHGRNGEDGTVQGAAALAGIPLAGCGILASALCMDKDRAHRLAAAAGVRAPRSAVLRTETDGHRAIEFACRVGYPLFVKPVKAGSSLGVTKVQEPGELEAAVSAAFAYDDEVILEENIEGFEVGCALLGSSEPFAGEIDEIKLSNGFFDFEEKYTLKTSHIYVPARIPAETADRIRETAKLVYRTLGCSGFARVDLFLTPDGGIVFNEVNTIPGFTEHSRYPGMMKAAGLSFLTVLTRIIEEAAEG